MFLSGSSEKKLIQFLRKIGWGEVKVKVENGKPVLIYEAIRTYKLEERSQSPQVAAGAKKTRGHLKVFK